MKYLILLALFPALCLASLRADLNGDRRVDFQDLSILASEWMCEDMGDYALKFNGVDQYVTVANNAALNFGTGDFSISFWANMDAMIIDNPTIIDKMPTNVGYYIVYGKSRKDYKLIFQDGASGISEIASNPSGVGWHNIIFSVDRNGVGTCYIDSVAGPASTSLALSLNTLTNTGALTIGKFSTDFAAFMIDDIRFYQCAITEADAAEIFNGGRGLKYAALSTGKVASWASDCDLGADVDTLYDAVGTVNGTLVGNVGNNMWEAGGVPLDIASIFDRTRGTFPSGGSMFARTR
jgi:hypothetical protein